MTLTCMETESHLVDVLDGRLGPPLEMRVHAHLEGCAACQQKAELWRKLVPGMRALVPTPPAELGARRLQVEVLRQLQSAGEVRARAPRRWMAGTGAAVLLAAAAVVALWLHGPGKPGTQAGTGAPAYATVTRIVGNVTSGRGGLAPSASLAAGAEIEVAAAGEVELRMDRGSVLRLRGPARLALGGSARDVQLALGEGTLEAEVAHRLSGETFAVSTRDARVEVRGTRFVVATGPAGSSVRVSEGLVAVRLSDGSSRMVGAGESATTETSGAAASEVMPDAVPAEAPSCAQAARGCQGAARAARQSMRGGDNDRALRLVAGASRSTRDGAPACSRELLACEDELGYLRAEALRGAGRIDDAVSAYKALNRAGAPAAMRQNALYAAAELERRKGRAREAGADYESALLVAPRGALHEEALVGSMESAAQAGERGRASAFARRYLSEFPTGRAAPAAQRLVDAAAGNAAPRPE
jgi:ferric-dicitrate binding protein FerR (iron transport regulator)